MYCLSERHLSIAQKTIQAAHAIIEYSLRFGNTVEYQHWANYDKTIIVLDGGNSKDLRETIIKLTDIEHCYEMFMEPDMNDFTTSIAFLVDERVFNYESYGRNFAEWRDMQIAKNRDSQTYTDPETGITIMNCLCVIPPTYEQWLDIIGGKKQEVLKEIISSKRLAQ